MNEQTQFIISTEEFVDSTKPYMGIYFINDEGKTTLNTANFALGDEITMETIDSFHVIINALLDHMVEEDVIQDGISAGVTAYHNNLETAGTISMVGYNLLVKRGVTMRFTLSTDHTIWRDIIDGSEGEFDKTF
jgi:hypothetical protein